MKFSERLGFKSVKEQLQVDSIDDELKNSLWSVYLEFFLQKLDNCDISPQLTNFGRSLWYNFFKKPIDTLPIDHYGILDTDWLTKFLRNYFYSDQRIWFELYDILEFSVPFGSQEFINSTNIILDKEKSAFRFVNERLVQITSKVEISEIEEAITSSDKYQSVNTHLNEALKMLADKEKPNYRNSIKESISAVEAMCKIFTNNLKTTLGEALNKLEKEYGLHPALKKSFSSLYGYTSDEGGIRHALIEGDKQIDFHEAKFMLVTCSSFINYLISRQT